MYPVDEIASIIQNTHEHPSIHVGDNAARDICMGIKNDFG